MSPKLCKRRIDYGSALEELLVLAALGGIEVVAEVGDVSHVRELIRVGDHVLSVENLERHNQQTKGANMSGR